MQSENFNLDDLFREKEAEANANLRLREQGKERLFDRMHTAPMQQTGGRSFTVFYQAAAVLVLVMAAIYFASDLSKESKPVSVIQPNTKDQNKPENPQPVQQKNNPEISTSLIAPAPAKVKNEVALQSDNKRVDQSMVNQRDLPDENKQSVPVALNNKVPGVNTLQASTLILHKFFTSLQKPPQVFMIETGEDQTIRGDEGTKIFIPANTFVESGGRTVSGKVKFSLIECYRLDQIMAHKLSTTSNGRLLETGGMLYMHATANGREVFIAEGAALDVSMPAKNFHPKMQLFYGSNTITADEAIDESTGKDFALRPSDEVKITTAAQVPIVEASAQADPAFTPGPNNWLPAGQEQLEWTSKRQTVRVVNYIDNPVTVKDVKGKMVAHYIISPSCDLTVEQVKKELEKRYLSRYDEILVTRESKFKKQISTNPFQPSVYTGDSVTMPMKMAMQLKLITKKDSARLEQEWQRELEILEEQKRSFEQLVTLRKTYDFRIARLGWVNCDRFLQIPKSEVFEYTVRPQIYFDNNVCFSAVIYHKTRSMVEGSFANGQFYYSRLPKNGDATIVCLGVKDGVTYMGTKEVRINQNTPEVQMKETNPEEFKALMARFIF